MVTLNSAAVERWKERWRTSEILYARIASQNPDRGFFIANIEETYQLYAWDLKQDSYSQLTDLSGGVNRAAILSDGSGVIYHRDEAGTEMGHYHHVSFDGGHLTDLTPDLPEYSRAGWSTASNSNHLAFTTGSENGFATYVHQGVLANSGDDLNLIYESKEFSGGPELSWNGRLLVLHTTENQEGSRFSILAFNAATSERINELTDGPTNSIEAVGFSPAENDYRILAFSDHSGVVRPLIWDPLSDHREDLEFPELEGDVKPLDWSPDGMAILIMQIFQAKQMLFSFNLESRKLQALDTTPASLGYGGGWYGFEAFFKQDGRVVALLQDAQTPGHLVELDPGSGERLGDLLYIKRPPEGGKWESVEFKSEGGIVIQGWLGKPMNGNPPYPTIIHTHGGPEGVMTNSYHAGSQAWMDHGFAFLTVNYRGSTTFGKEFKECIWGQPGTYEVEDIVAARRWLVEEGVADPERVFLTGYSYGGYLTLQAMGKEPGLWAGGMALAAITDWIMSREYENPTLKAFGDRLFLGSPEEKPEAWKEASPISYAENLVAPILIIQGSNDSRTPAEPIHVYEKKLKDLGKDIQVQWYEAGHLGPTTDQWIEFTQLMLDFANSKLN
ncbi:MAG: prolyl oligopeptidase family serine peptidase [Anaerolineales bacterium]